MAASTPMPVVIGNVLDGNVGPAAVAPQPIGLGIAPAALQAEVQRRELRAQGRPSKDKQKGGNDTFSASERNTRPYILARLERDGHAALAAQVQAGELDAWAGTRPGTVTPIRRVSA